MALLNEETFVSQERISSVAQTLSRHANRGSGMAHAHCVRLTPAVLSLVNAAKAEKQSVVNFLKEAAVTVALQRLEASQK
jgi:hypothetical protein